MGLQTDRSPVSAIVVHWVRSRNQTLIPALTLDRVLSGEPARMGFSGGMAVFKFLHTADIHLDSPLRGLSRYEGVPVDQVRLATRAALTNLVDHAIGEAVSFVVIAGDLFDG